MPPSSASDETVTHKRSKFELAEEDHQPNRHRVTLDKPCPECGSRVIACGGCKVCIYCGYSPCV